MKLLEFLRITEARRIFFRPTVEPPNGVLLIGQKRQPPKAAIIPLDGQKLSQSSNILVIRAKVRTGNQLNRELIRRREEDPDWQEAWYGWGRGRVDPSIAERYPQVFNAITIDSPGALFRFMTTDLGLERETYEQIIGPAPDDVGDNAINFHGARLFVPTNMSKRGLAAANKTLETVYQHLSRAGLDYLFKDTDIRFKKLPTNVGGEYVPSTGDMNVNPSIKNPGQTIYSLLHEFGHMFYYQFAGSNTKQAIAAKFEDVKMDGEGYAGDMGYFMQLQDAMSQIQKGDTAVYKGRKRAWKQMGKLVVDHVGIAKTPSGDVPSVWLHRVRENGSTTAAGRVPMQLYLDPKRWETGITQPEETPMHQRKSDDWFPTHYSENAPRHNDEGEEWWAELFAFHTLGNLDGEPEAWISKVVDTYRQQLAASVGSNEGEVNSDDECPQEPPAHGDEEGNASWDWTDPYHSSGEENAVMSRTP